MLKLKCSHCALVRSSNSNFQVRRDCYCGARSLQPVALSAHPQNSKFVCLPNSISCLIFIILITIFVIVIAIVFDRLIILNFVVVVLVDQTCSPC